MDLILRSARVRGHDKPVDIAVNDGVITRIAPKVAARARQVIDCAGKLVSPPFTDIHVHLDAALTVGQPRFNQSGTLIEGIEIWAEHKKSLTFDDVKRRATLAVKWELAHGVTRIRSHVDVCDPRLTAVQALVEVKKEFAGLVDVVAADALAVGEAEVGRPTVLAANLPYNVAVPVVLNLLAALPSLERGIVMVQAEVADRMCAGPGGRVYGAPSAKLAWYASARLAGTVPRSVFWPVPNVDSKLVAFTRHDPPPGSASRAEVFAVVDAAFGQRRKTLRAALGGWAGSPAEAERLLRAAGVDPGARGESLPIGRASCRERVFVGV